MSLSPLTPPLPPRKVCLCHIFFALLAMNDPLPAAVNCMENIELKYLLLFIDLQLEGYIHAQSPVKTVRNSRTPYFDCLVQTDKDKKVCAICFDPPKRVNLQQAYQQKSPVKICGIKRSSSTSFSNNQDQYKILKQAKVLPTSTHFEYNAEIASSLLTVKQAQPRSVGWVGENPGIEVETSSLSRSVQEH